MAFLLDEKKNLTLIKQIISRKNELSADYLYEGTTIYSHSIFSVNNEKGYIILIFNTLTPALYTLLYIVVSKSGVNLILPRKNCLILLKEMGQFFGTIELGQTIKTS